MISAIINFVLKASVVYFLIVKPFANLAARLVATTPPPAQEQLLREIRDLLKERHRASRSWPSASRARSAAQPAARVAQPRQLPGGSPARPAGFTLVFSDEFDTPGSPDPAKWGYEIGYVRNDEKRYYTSRPENVRAEGGKLVIEGRKEAYQGYGYTSASVNTLGRFEFRYGRVEVRAKLPDRPGHLAGHLDARHQHRRRSAGRRAARSTSWRTSASTRCVVHASIHTGRATTTRSAPRRRASTLVPDPTRRLPRLRMEWYPTASSTFVDGVTYFTFRNEGTGAAAWPFDEPQYLLDQPRDRRTWGGQKGIDDSLFPHRYLVDYVRIYQQS